jgi:uncharacterized membrane protein
MEPKDDDYPPWFSPWDLWPLAAALILLVTLPALMNGLPDPIPTHFDASGRPNGWTPKANYPWLCFGLPFFGWVVILLLGRAFAGTDQDPDGQKCRAMSPLRGLLTLGLFGLTGGGLLIPRHGHVVILWMLAGFLATTVLGIVLMMRELKRTLPEGGLDEHYVWGIFYVNAEDPALWVPKRLGLGWTLNFAHGLSWAILVLLLLTPIVIVSLVLSR